MPDYKQGKIYALRSHQTNKIYIGSTTQSLAQRMAKHRNQYKTLPKNKLTKAYEILKYEDAYIELMENYPCDGRENLLKKEGEHIRNNTECVNKQIAGRTNEEYRQEHIEEIKQYMREKYMRDREKILRPYYCHCGGTYKWQGREKHYRTKKHKNHIDSLYDISDIQKLFIH